MRFFQKFSFFSIFSFLIIMIHIFRRRIIFQHVKKYNLTNIGDEIRSIRVKKLFFTKIVNFGSFS